MKRATLYLTIILLSSTLTSGREPKEYDSDVLYEESQIPHYDLPPLLVTAEGKPVTTAEQWRSVRRPQILSLFSNLVYGRVPEPASPIETEFAVQNSDPEFVGGKATRKEVQIRFRNDKGEARMFVLVFVPNRSGKPVLALMKHSFNNTRSHDFEAHPLRRDRLQNGWPLGETIDRGYAFVAVYQQDLVRHNEVEFLSGIHPLFYRKGLTSKASPPVGKAIVASDVGYHIREGGHSIEDQDWQHFLDFADCHFAKRGESAL